MSNFVVSARKYRPVRFDEVVGQNHVSKTLKNALKTDHLGHSFLFCGPRGVGKTTSARILAKVLNCENRTEDFEPCNTCSSCEAFNNNSSFNIYELDAASNNSVDDIRSLVDQVRFPPQQGNYKVYIIDEVHMLSQSAFNAFLKTLEEPPSYAIFILATTEKHKILPTILSRCQIFDFNRVQIEDMVAHLQHICEKEGISAEETALHTIAEKADGALRDALSIFDRITSYSGKEITYQTVTESLNILDYETFFALTNALIIQDKNRVLNLFNDVLLKGFDGDQVILGLAEHFRNLMVAREPEIINLLSVAPSVKDDYIKQAAQTKLSFLLNALNIANDCDIHFRQAKNKRLHVELALLKMCFLGNVLHNQPLPEGEVKKNTNLEAPKEVSTLSTISAPPKLEKPIEKTEPEEREVKSVEEEQSEVQSAESMEMVEQKEESQPAQINTIEDQKITTPKETIVEEKEIPIQKVPSKVSSSTFSLADLESRIQEKKEQEKELIQEQKEQTVEDDTATPIELNKEEEQLVIDAWKELELIFKERNATTLETAIQDSKISYQNGAIEVTVQGQIVKDMLQEQYSFIVEHIKQKTGLQKFSFNLIAQEIDVKAVKTFTKQEQLDYIMQQNPSVARLCRELNLEINYNN